MKYQIKIIVKIYPNHYLIFNKQQPYLYLNYNNIHCRVLKLADKPSGLGGEDDRINLPVGVTNCFVEVRVLLLQLIHLITGHCGVLKLADKPSGLEGEDNGINF
ncbi:MAG: hypothetical protein AAF519_05330 [Bacteroidota bacterium]